MKIPSINKLRTIATLQTNAPKILYGSGVVGAGRKDVYQTFKSLRGEFTQVRANRQLGNGTVVQVLKWQFITRYESAIMAVLDLQVRFLIDGKVYTLDTFNVDTSGKNEWFIFTLSQFGK
jgi:hypothetical protein